MSQPKPHPPRTPRVKAQAARTRRIRIAIVSSGAPDAEEAARQLAERYGDVPLGDAEVVVALGGDGLMLQTMHSLMGSGKPIYGMNRGSVGFLMNDFRATGLSKRVAEAERSIVHPLLMTVTDHNGRKKTARAINEVHLLRQSYQAAKLRILVDDKPRLDELIADGVLVATPAGSTASNLSVNGPTARAHADLALPAPALARRAPARRGLRLDRGAGGGEAASRGRGRPYGIPRRAARRRGARPLDRHRRAA